MKRFANEYPDFPFLQVPLAKLEEDEKSNKTRDVTYC